MSDLSAKATSFAKDLGEAARQNPLSAALIGMGVLWLFTGGRPVERAGDFVRGSGLDRIPGVANDAFDAARAGFRSGADTVGGGIASATGAVRDSAAAAFDGATRFGREQADAASDYFRSVPDTGAEMFDMARSNLTELFRAQPLALGAIGLAIGAGIAAALPTSDVEAEYLGETSDSLKAKATQFATEQTTRATAVAGEVVEAVSEEVRRQGLTVESAKSAVGDISAKVGRVVDAAGKGISGRVKSTTP